MGTKLQQKTFANFATLRFENSHFISYERKPLTQALLKLSSRLDQEAARTVSLAILRYIEDDVDLPGPYPNQSLYRELISGLKQGSKDGKFSPYSLIQGRKTSDLDNVHLICGLGILGPQLRDEIFCQVCKQINGNSNDKSRQKTWTLLGCCICSFLPSDEFLPYLENILKWAPKVEQPFFEEKLTRTKLNGNRREPPSSIDHRAIENRGKFSHDIMLMNGQVCKLPLDPATTGMELRKKIATARGLVDLFGFSFRVNVRDQISVVVCGSDHIMDVISSCEQIAKEFNLDDVCAIVFFKEIFSPWQNPSFDSKASQLIYSQMISSIKLNRYAIKEDLILSKMIALHCFVLHGPDADRKHVEETVQALTPNNLMTKKNSKEYWIQMTESHFHKKYRRDKSMNRRKAMGTLIIHAKHNMTKEFCRHFELVSVHGPKNDGHAAVLSVNWKNIHVRPSQPTFSTWSLTFSEMKNVSYEKLSDRRIGTVTITTVDANEHKLASPKAEDIHGLLNFFLSGLRNRSRYLLALRDHQPVDNSMGQLGFVDGDLIILKGACNGETLQTTGRGYGVCHRTGASGEFTGGLFYIIPTLETPSTSLMEVLRNSPINTAKKSKVNRHDSASILSRSRSNYKLARQTSSKPTVQSSQMFLDSRRNEYVNLQNGNIDVFLDSKQRKNMTNNYDIPLVPSIQETSVVEKPFNSDLYFGSTPVGRADLIASDPPKAFIQELKAPENAGNDYDYTDSSNQFQERESFKTSEINLSELHGAVNSESYIGLTTNGDDDVAVYNPIYEAPSTNDKASIQQIDLDLNPESQRKSLEDAVHENHLAQDEGIADSESYIDLTTNGDDDIAVYNPIYEVPSTDDKPSIQQINLDFNQESQRKALENAVDENHLAQDKSIDTSSLVKKNTRPRRQATILFKDSSSYQAILTYVSQPAGDIMSEMTLTDTIFGKPLSNTTSEDNVYLEVIQHIRTEEDITMVERSWELMWLITGLYPCSENIKDDVISLLRSTTEGNSLARQCYMRLVKMITHGRRTYPPHIAEVQAIQTRMDLINHKVFFPDGSCQSFEVESATTAGHLISVITESTGLKNPSGCGLFFKIGEKVFGVAEEYFFFDFIQHFIEIWRRSETAMYMGPSVRCINRLQEYNYHSKLCKLRFRFGSSIAMNYQVFFLRKVWINVIPGADRVADCRLHYYQELSKYLRGYHKCVKEDCVSLAALIFRAEFGEDTEYLSEIPDMLNRLVPEDVISEMSVDEWQQALEEALFGNSDYVGDDAKIQFLKDLSKWTSFGSAFFHAKVIDPSSLPETVLIAIQKNGFTLMNATEKIIIEKYSFNEIERWSSGGQTFSVDIKTATERKKFVFKTSLDYQIDDFLTSYIAVHGSQHLQEECTTSDEG